MLAVILKILQITGIVLLSILGLVLVLLILALVLPATYRLTCTAEDGKKPVVLFKLSYFLGLLRARADYTDALYVKVKVLFFTVYELTVPNKDNQDDEEYDLSELDEALEAMDEEDLDSDTAPESDNLDVSEGPYDEEACEEPVSETKEETESTDSDENADNSTVNEETEEKEDSLFSKIKFKVEEICDKIKRARSEIRYYSNLYNSNEAKDAIFVIKKRSKKIFSKIMPRRAHADVTFGFDSPDLTGKVYGIYTMFARRFDKSSVVCPDFERKVFEGQIRFKGHFNLWGILWNALMIVLNRNVQKIYKSYKHHKDMKEKHEAAEDKAA